MAIATWLLSDFVYNFSSVRYDMLDKTFSGNIIIWGAGWSGAE